VSINTIVLYLLHTTMVASIRSTHRAKTPSNVLSPGEADTMKRTKFLTPGMKTRIRKAGMNSRARIGYNPPTTTKWLNQREELGSPAHRRTRKLSDKLGRASRIQKKNVKTLLNPKKNPFRKERYEVRIKYF
jgi:hypothetical protein